VFLFSYLTFNLSQEYTPRVFIVKYPGGVSIHRGNFLLWQLEKNFKEHGQVVRIRATLVADEEIIR
jgi:hypothetical protein